MKATGRATVFLMTAGLALAAGTPSAMTADDHIAPAAQPESATLGDSPPAR